MPVDVPAEVTANYPLSPDYNIVTFEAAPIADMAAPGQFVMVKAARGSDPLLRRPFSVFEIFRDERRRPVGFSLLNKRIGPSTSLLYSARPGDRVSVVGPLGRPFSMVEAPGEAWMVAGGVGLAPFATLAGELRARGVKATLFYGARRAGELFCLNLFREMEVELVLTTEDGSAGEHGRVTAPLERRLTTAAGGPAMIYACGPEGMLAATARLAMRHNRPCQVSVERVMGCGLGGCYSCVVPMRTAAGGFHHVRSCISGPVLAGDQILWD